MRWNTAWALVAFVPVALAAQRPDRAPEPTQPNVIVTGCVERAERNGSVGGTPVGTTAQSPNTADDEANSQEPVDRFLLTGAVVNPAAGGSGASTQATRGPQTAQELKAFALHGHEAELRSHAGHRVQVTGVLEPPRQPTRTRAEAASASGVQRLRVQSVRMIKASCAA
jgi:hypothetical protein